MPIAWLPALNSSVWLPSRIALPSTKTYACFGLTWILTLPVAGLLCACAEARPSDPTAKTTRNNRPHVPILMAEALLCERCAHDALISYHDVYSSWNDT